MVPLARSAITNMPAMRGERADEDEGADLVAVGVDADEARHLGVAAGGVHVAAEDGAAEDEVGDEGGDDEEDEAPAEAEDDVGHAEGADRGRQRIDRRAVGHDLDQALADEEHAERLDEGGDAEAHHDEAVDEADAARRSARPPRIATGTGRAAAVISLAATTAREAGDRADREVELAGDQQHRLADGDDADEGDDAQDGADVALGDEGGLDGGEEARPAGSARR